MITEPIGISSGPTDHAKNEGASVGRCPSSPGARDALRGVAHLVRVRFRLCLILLFLVQGSCTARAPEQRYQQRMEKLTRNMEKLQERIEQEQRKEMERRKKAWQEQ